MELLSLPAIAPHAVRTDAPRAAPAATPPAAERAVGHWLAAILDEIDYGVLLAAEDASVLYSNHAARRTLRDTHPLALERQALRAADPGDAERLRSALRDAVGLGRRRMLGFGSGARRVPVAVLPAAGGPDERPAALLLLGRSSVCETLSAHGFAACHGLTSAESAVLAQLARGRSPVAIARAHGVAISTVRSQIASIRQKTGAASIRDLVELVARLPPLVGVLRH